jgi:hypothetical protein
MRTLLVASIALVLVVLPAAQAAACRCDAEESAASCGCCCADRDRACSCCPTDAGDEEETPTGLDEACPCSQSVPQAPTPEADGLPAGETLASTPDVPGSTGRAHVTATVERRSPHPTVSLPLLL